MRMGQYICHTDHNLWDIIINGDLQEESAQTGDQSGPSAPPVPKTAKQLATKRNQEKTSKRFGGNEESKKMQKNVLKHQFENFTTASNESLDKAYDRFQKLISQLEVHGAPISKEDINQKFLRRVYEDEMKRSSSSTSTSQNLAFLSSENTSSTNEVSTASGDFRVSTAGGISQVSTTPCALYVVLLFFAQPTTSPQLENEDFQQIDEDDLEELDLRWQVAMLTVRVKKFIQKTGRNLDFKEKRPVSLDKSKIECYNCHRKGHFVGMQIWKGFKGEVFMVTHVRSNAPTNESSSQALVAQDGLGGYENLEIMTVKKREKNIAELDEIQGYEISDEENTLANNRFSKADGFHAVPPHITGNFLTPRADISFADDEDDVSEVQTISHVKTNETQTVKTRVDKIGQTSQKQGIGFKKIKACFVCKSTDHLIKDYDFHDKQSQEPKLKTVGNTSPRVVKPVWDNAKRQNEKRAVHKVSTTRPVSTARPISIARPVSTVRPFAPKIRSYYRKQAFRPKDLKQDVKTFRVQNMTTARARALVNTGKGKMDTDLKKSRWVWRPKGNYLDHMSKYSGSFMLKKGNPEILLQDHAVVDSGCSSHMTGNKAYLSDYEDYNGGFVAFGSDPKGDELKFNLFSVSQMCDKKNSVLFTESECLILSPSFKLLDESQVVLRAPRKDDVYSLDLKNIIPSGGITCLYANATADESKLWHRRLGHVNFKNINKLVKGHLVRGLPSKVFVNDHTCVACKKGKQHKASCKAKLERIIRKPLELLHMDLFGPVSVESINKKRYCLVVTDDFSRFSWVFFLATKDETSEILCKFIIGLENQLNHNVKIIRCDNGTEFKNHAMNEFCAKKGIKREFSVARTPQQNGVAERKNRTLIEAARTMLADSLLPIPFWAEAVNTACYVLNRVLVTKPQNKTPYELLIGNSPSISFMRPFGCPLTILNTLDSLGKFDGKSDEGYLLGYSTTSKAFRVYNKRTKRVEENLHIDFLEDQPNVAGTGPNWMFDLDFLTNSMNYIPVSVENQVNVDAGTQDSYVAGSSGKDKGPTQEYILLPLQPHRTRIPVKDVVQDAQEQPSENASPDKGIQVSEDVFDKEGQHQMPEDEQVWQDELEMMITQEVVANAMNDESRQAFEEEKRRIASQKKAAQATSTNQLSTVRPFVSTGRSSVSTDRSNTPNVSAASTSTGANADKSSFVYLGGKIPIDASTLPNADLPIDPNMPDLEDASDTLPNDGIFNGAYDDDEDVGAVADFNNMDNTIAVSPIPTLRIHKDHPKGQILGDPTSAVQTRGKIQKALSYIMLSFARGQWRQFKFTAGLDTLELPFGQKAIGTKATKKEGIDYDEVFAPVARIEAIRLFLAFASYKGFLALLILLIQPKSIRRVEALLGYIKAPRAGLRHLFFPVGEWFEKRSHRQNSILSDD
ncbi:putative ribonuclease H-like domain-containing protein [Tanacetum coccineum]